MKLALSLADYTIVTSYLNSGGRARRHSVHQPPSERRLDGVKARDPATATSRLGTDTSRLPPSTCNRTATRSRPDKRQIPSSPANAPAVILTAVPGDWPATLAERSAREGGSEGYRVEDRVSYVLFQPFVVYGELFERHCRSTSTLSQVHEQLARGQATGIAIAIERRFALPGGCSSYGTSCASSQ
jgi:hypothetical protein